MKTVIELYDRDTVFNISAAVAIKPENIVFICGKNTGKKRKNIIIRLLRKYCPQTKIYFYETERHNCEEAERLLTEIYEKFPDCAIELTGGSEVLAYGAGRFSKEKELNAFVYKAEIGKSIYVSGPKTGKEYYYEIKLDIEDFAIMAGGRYLKHGHFDVNSFGEETFSDAHKVWKIFIQNKESWHKQVAYFQAISQLNSGGISYDMPVAVKKKDGNKILCDEKIMELLEKEGIISNFELKNEQVSFRFKNETIKKLLNDFGVWLELFIYKKAVDSNKFDNVDMSVIFDWNSVENEREDVLNEIDVMITKGITPVFISCKAGSVSTSALNEIKTLASRFGGNYAKSVLVTAEELSKLSPKTYRRAVEMGISVIELEDLIREDPSSIIERIILKR